jgi:hypothetical protein
MEDNLEMLSFNKRFSDLKLRWVLRKKYNYTKRFLYAITERIKDNSNLIIVIYGTPNSGKSEGAQTIAFFIRYCLWRHVGLKVKIKTAFSTADFQEITPNMKRGDVGIRDESSALSGAGARNTQADLNNITKAIRMEQNSFIFIDPTKIVAKVVSFYLESAGKNKNTRKIRFVLYDKDENILGHIYLPLHWSPLYRKRYKEKKQVNIDTLKTFGGMAKAELPKRIEFDEKRLLHYCNEYNVKNRGDIEALLQRFNRECEDDKDMIKGDTNYIKILVQTVWLDIREERLIKKERVQEIKRNIKFIQGDIFADFVRQNIPENAGGRPNYTVAKIAEGLAKGYSHDAIKANYKDIGPGIVNKVSIWIRREAPIDIRLGFLFEKWYALNIGVPLEQLDELLGGNIGNKPDLIWNNKIYSLKFNIVHHKRTISFIQSIDLSPEFREARKRKCNYTLVFMNPAWDLKVQLIEIDPFDDPDKIIIKRPDLIVEKPTKKLIL